MRLNSVILVPVICVGVGLALASTTNAADGPEKVSDEWVGLSLTVPKPWVRSALKGYTVPGALRCAWTGLGDSSLLVFVQEPGAAVDPRTMLDSSAASQRANLGVEVLTQEVRT